MFSSINTISICQILRVWTITSEIKCSLTYIFGMLVRFDPLSVKFKSESSWSQNETTQTAVDSTVCTVNAYTVGDL